MKLRNKFNEINKQHGANFDISDVLWEKILSLIEAENKSAYERGYHHGHKIGHEEGKQGYEPDTNASTETPTSSRKGAK